jgi:hypothetical protein
LQEREGEKMSGVGERQMEEISAMLSDIMTLSGKIHVELSSQEIGGLQYREGERDMEIITMLPKGMEELKDLLKCMEDDWKCVIEDKVDLGTITSYDGSIFNPQQIPLVQIIHCIISDTLMLLKDTMDILTSNQSTIDYTQIINNIYSTIAASRFLYTTQSTNMNEKRIYPSINCLQTADKIIDMLNELNANN